MEEDDLRGGVVKDPRNLVRREPDVDRIEDGSRLDDAVVRLEKMMGVERDERDAVAGPDAELDEGVGKAMGARRELAIGELRIAVDDPDLVAKERGRAIAEFQD